MLLGFRMSSIKSIKLAPLAQPHETVLSRNHPLCVLTDNRPKEGLWRCMSALIHDKLDADPAVHKRILVFLSYCVFFVLMCIDIEKTLKIGIGNRFEKNVTLGLFQRERERPIGCSTNVDVCSCTLLLLTEDNGG